MGRFLDSISDLSFKRGRIHVASTGAVIALDRSFWKSAASGFKIYLYFYARALKRIFTRSKTNGTIAFYPQTPGPWYNIWQVIRLAGLRTVSELSKADHIFIFEDTTFSKFDRSVLDGFNGRLLNFDIQDISKEHVADIFEEVFGYGLRVDPTTHDGLAIQKSNDNGTHDGIVLNCPIDEAEIDPTQAYQRLVDSTFKGDASEDLRVAFVLGEIALIYHKYKPLEDRFGTYYLQVNLEQAADVFSKDEIELILRFSKKMGLDFGAIDVMRDKHDGRIYIVDVNKTCMPVLSLDLKSQIKAQGRISEAFMRGLKLV